MKTPSPAGTPCPQERSRAFCQSRPGRAASIAHRRARLLLRHLSGTQGTALYEFAWSMPLLLVTVVAITDFGQAFNTKHILTNAAREAARITVSNPLSDANCAVTDPPCSIQASAEAVKNYLTNAALSQASCITPATPSSGSLATLKWTYTCNNITLTIDRSLVLTGGPNGTVIPSAQVTLSYPYTWTLNRVIGLLPHDKGTPAFSLSLPASVTASVVMQILVTG